MHTSKIQEYKPQYINYDGGFISDHPGERYYNDDGSDPTVEPQRPDATLVGSPLTTATQAQAAQRKAFISLRVLADLKASVSRGATTIATATETAKRILSSLINDPALDAAIAKGSAKLLTAKARLISAKLALSSMSSADAANTSSSSFTDTLESITNSISNLADAYATVTGKTTQTTGAAPAPPAPTTAGLSSGAWVAIAAGGLALVILVVVLASRN